MKKLVIAAAVAAFIGPMTAFATCGVSDPCGTPEPDCGPTGCSTAGGEANIWASGASMAFGDTTRTLSFGQYELNYDSPDASGNIGGAWEALSEGHGFSEAGGAGFGNIGWERTDWW